MAGQVQLFIDLVHSPHPIAMFYTRYLLERGILQNSGKLSKHYYDYLYNDLINFDFRYFIVSGKYLKGPVTTVGLALVPTDSCDKICPYEIDLNLGEVKVSKEPVPISIIVCFLCVAIPDCVCD